jgi:zinc-finger protein CreA/MIG
LTDLHELEVAEFRRRAEYEQRHAELVRDASRSLGRARLSKSAGASPVLAPVGHSGLGMLLMPEDVQPSPVHAHSASICSHQNGAAGIPLPPSCHHEDCHKSYRKALKASRRYSGPSLPPVPPLSLDNVSNGASKVDDLSNAYHSSAAGAHSQSHLQARPSSPSHLHGYSPYSRPSPPTGEKDRDNFMINNSSSSVGSSGSVSQSDYLYSAPIYGISSQLGLSNERSTSGPVTQAQYTPSASPFLRPLQSLGLDSPSVSPKMGQSALGMLAPSDAHIGEMSFLDAGGVRTHEPPVFGKRRDSSTTVTPHDFARADLRVALPQVKCESTPTSPTWRSVYNPAHSSSVSPSPTGHGATSMSSSPPSPALHSHSLPHTPYHMRGHPPHYHHLAHSVRMAFAMTPIKHPGSGSAHALHPYAYSQLSAESTPHPSRSSSSPRISPRHNSQMPGSHFPYSQFPSRAGSPPIMLPPLSSSTPNSSAATSSRAPSPLGYITLPPLKAYGPTGTVKPTTEPDDALGIPGEGAGFLMNGDAVSNSSAAPGERITLPGFSEIIRAADS